MNSEIHIHTTPEGRLELDVRTAPGEELLVGGLVDMYTPTGMNDHLNPAAPDATGEIRRTLAPDVQLASIQQALGHMGSELLFD